MTSCERILDALREAGLLRRKSGPDIEAITGLTENSRLVQPGQLFCAIRGTTDDGHRFIGDAVERGAGALLVERQADVSLPQIVVEDSKAATCIAAAEWYGHPSRDLSLVGVTGTNGKSTTVSLLCHLLGDPGTVGSIGTLGAFDGRGDSLYREGLTTPGVVQLQETLSKMRAARTRMVAMEVSSHALDQGRVAGLAFASACFTNLTHDHLDYHSSFEDYLSSKLRLADHVARDGTLVVNADDPAWESLQTGEGLRRVTFSLRGPADVSAHAVVLGAHGSTFDVKLGDTTRNVAIPLLGEFNVSNSLAAMAVAWSLGTPIDDIVARLETAPQVPGRMEQLVSEKFLVLRDYSHTPDALERAIAAVRPLTSGRLVVLFGCGGDRDRSKRAPMGAIAASGADIAIVTSDNPRTEDPEQILDEIEEGLVGRNHLRVTDRREAIEQGLAMLQEGDCLLLAGKGHETYQVIGTERHPFDERQIVLEIYNRVEQ